MTHPRYAFTRASPTCIVDEPTHETHTTAHTNHVRDTGYTRVAIASERPRTYAPRFVVSSEAWGMSALPVGSKISLASAGDTYPGDDPGLYVFLWGECRGEERFAWI